MIKKLIYSLGLLFIVTLAHATTENQTVDYEAPSFKRPYLLKRECVCPASYYEDAHTIGLSREASNCCASSFWNGTTLCLCGVNAVILAASVKIPCLAFLLPGTCMPLCMTCYLGPAHSAAAMHARSVFADQFDESMQIIASYEKDIIQKGKSEQGQIIEALKIVASFRNAGFDYADLSQAGRPAARCLELCGVDTCMQCCSYPSMAQHMDKLEKTTEKHLQYLLNAAIHTQLYKMRTKILANRSSLTRGISSEFDDAHSLFAFYFKLMMGEELAVNERADLRDLEALRALLKTQKLLGDSDEIRKTPAYLSLGKKGWMETCIKLLGCLGGASHDE